MPRHSRLSLDDLNEIRDLYSGGMSREHISKLLEARGIVIHPTTIYYHLGLKKQKLHVKSYLDYVREDCERRGSVSESTSARQ
jgi:hypothetical protein